MKIKKNINIQGQLRQGREEIPQPDDRLKSRLHQDIPGEYTGIKLATRRRVKFQLAAAFVIIASIVIVIFSNHRERPEFPEDYFRPTIVISLLDEEPLEDTFIPTRVVKITEKDLLAIEEDQRYENHEI